MICQFASGGYGSVVTLGQLRQRGVSVGTVVECCYLKVLLSKSGDDRRRGVRRRPVIALPA